MHIDMTGGKPIKCSKCGSTNAIKPINQRDVAVRCGDCGHTKLTQEAERRNMERELGAQGLEQLGAWKHDRDKEPTF